MMMQRAYEAGRLIVLLIGIVGTCFFAFYVPLRYGLGAMNPTLIALFVGIMQGPAALRALTDRGSRMLPPPPSGTVRPAKLTMTQKLPLPADPDTP